MDARTARPIGEYSPRPYQGCGWFGLVDRVGGTAAGQLQTVPVPEYLWQSGRSPPAVNLRHIYGAEPDRRERANATEYIHRAYLTFSSAKKIVRCEETLCVF